MVGHDALEQYRVKEQDHVQEQPTDPQKDGRRVVTFLARCVAQQESTVRYVVGLKAHSRCHEDLKNDDEVKTEAKLP